MPFNSLETERVRIQLVEVVNCLLVRTSGFLPLLGPDHTNVTIRKNLRGIVHNSVR